MKHVVPWFLVFRHHSQYFFKTEVKNFIASPPKWSSAFYHTCPTEPQTLAEYYPFSSLFYSCRLVLDFTHDYLWTTLPVLYQLSPNPLKSYSISFTLPSSVSTCNWIHTLPPSSGPLFNDIYTQSPRLSGHGSKLFLPPGSLTNSLLPSSACFHWCPLLSPVILFQLNISFQLTIMLVSLSLSPL